MAPSGQLGPQASWTLLSTRKPLTCGNAGLIFGCAALVQAAGRDGVQGLGGRAAPPALCGPAAAHQRHRSALTTKRVCWVFDSALAALLQALPSAEQLTCLEIQSVESFINQDPAAAPEYQAPFFSTEDVAILRALPSLQSIVGRHGGQLVAQVPPGSVLPGVNIKDS